MSFLGRCVGTGPSKIACTGYLVLDVTMGEDDCPIYRGDAAEILACIRHMGLNMLRAETSRKASVRRKQKIAGMSSEYLETVLNAGLKNWVNFNKMFTLSPWG